MKYKVLNIEFDDFQEVVQWAWDELKIELVEGSIQNEDDRALACRELEEVVSYVDHMDSEFGVPS